MTYRVEQDTMGEVRVDADRLWGAQTERSRNMFRIGVEKMPIQLIHAFAQLKQGCALVNHHLGLLAEEKKKLIVQVCGEILSGQLDQEFPLSVWQTGSGTQTNMNLNEVIANRATLVHSGTLSGARAVHPNDDVNMSQSSNDTFPTAMHIAAVVALEDLLLPAVARLCATLMSKSAAFADIIKIGRTHLQDATPLALGQEIGGWAAMLQANSKQLLESLEHLRFLAIGGTAVGTGLNAPAGFGELVAEALSRELKTSFYSAANKFQALSSHEPLVLASGALKALAANLLKIANDVRWLASGPRCGIGELSLPANEPGSSIMPGKVNPTQAEALSMVACQVFGNDTTIGFAASQGNFQLNVYKPVIIYNFLQSVGLLADAITSFDMHCLAGIEPIREKIEQNLQNSLMLVTALNPHLGYEKAAHIAKQAHGDNSTLREAAIKLGLLTGEQFDAYVQPKKMIGSTEK